MEISEWRIRMVAGVLSEVELPVLRQRFPSMHCLKNSKLIWMQLLSYFENPRSSLVGRASRALPT